MGNVTQRSSELGADLQPRVCHRVRLRRIAPEVGLSDELTGIDLACERPWAALPINSDSCAGSYTSKLVKRALSQLFVKCNIHYSPADLPPRLLRRYAQVVPVSRTLRCCYGQRKPRRRRQRKPLAWLRRPPLSNLLLIRG